MGIQAKKYRYILAFLLGVIILITSWIIWGNITVKTTIWNIHDINLQIVLRNIRFCFLIVQNYLILM